MKPIHRFAKIDALFVLEVTFNFFLRLLNFNRVLNYLNSFRNWSDKSLIKLDAGKIQPEQVGWKNKNLSHYSNCNLVIVMLLSHYRYDGIRCRSVSGFCCCLAYERTSAALRCLCDTRDSSSTFDISNIVRREYNAVRRTRRAAKPTSSPLMEPLSKVQYRYAASWSDSNSYIENTSLHTGEDVRLCSLGKHSRLEPPNQNF